MEESGSGKVWGIEPMVHRDSFRTLWMESMEDNQNFMKLYRRKSVFQSRKRQQD